VGGAYCAACHPVGCCYLLLRHPMFNRGAGFSCPPRAGYFQPSLRFASVGLPSPACTCTKFPNTLILLQSRRLQEGNGSPRSIT